MSSVAVCRCAAFARGRPPETGDHASLAEIRQAATEVGGVLATIARTTFLRGGWIGPGPTVGAPLMPGDHFVARMADECLAADNVRERLGPELCLRLSRIIWSFAGDLTVIDDAHGLVHGDFGPGNTLNHYLRRHVAGLRRA